MRTLFSFVPIAVLLIGCATPAKHSWPHQPPSNKASDVELLAVLFKEGRPQAGDSLLDSVVDVAFSKFALDHDARIINQVPQLKFYVVGASDPEECGAEGCNVLSRRRAQLVHEWLIAHGVSSTAMETPVYVGSSRPLTDTSTEDARAMNRRATIEFVWPARAGGASFDPAADPPPRASIAEFHWPRFKPGLPLGDESLEEALAESASIQLKSLRQTVAILVDDPALRASVVGHTDNSECRELACENLSLRRARLVRDWLVREGVRDSQLAPASGGGTRIPVAFNTTEKGRAHNRRVEINLL